MKRRMDVAQEMEEIMNLFHNNPEVSFSAVKVLSGYIHPNSQRKWAIYRLNELIKMGKIVKIKYGTYKSLNSSTK